MPKNIGDSIVPIPFTPSVREEWSRKVDLGYSISSFEERREILLRLRSKIPECLFTDGRDYHCNHPLFRFVHPGSWETQGRGTSAEVHQSEGPQSRVLGPVEVLR